METELKEILYDVRDKVNYIYNKERENNEPSNIRNEFMSLIKRMGDLQQEDRDSLMIELWTEIKQLQG